MTEVGEGMNPSSTWGLYISRGRGQVEVQELEASDEGADHQGSSRSPVAVWDGPSSLFGPGGPSGPLPGFPRAGALLMRRHGSGFGVASAKTFMSPHRRRMFGGVRMAGFSAVRNVGPWAF